MKMVFKALLINKVKDILVHLIFDVWFQVRRRFSISFLKKYFYFRRKYFYLL